MCRIPRPGLWTALAAAVLLTAGPGCDTLVVNQPPGTPLGDDKAATLAGSWVAVDEDGRQEGTLLLGHVNGSVYTLAILKWEGDDGTFEMLQLPVHVTAVGDAWFISIPAKPERDDDDPPPGLAIKAVDVTGWLLARLKPTDAGVDLIDFDTDAWAAAVDSGEIDGEVNRGEHSTDVRITAKKRDLDAFLRQQDLDKLFPIDGEQPLHLKRVAEMSD